MYVPPLLLKFTVLQITQDVEPSPALLCTCKFRPHSKRPLYLAIGYFAQMHGTEPLMRSERREYYVVDVVCEYAVLVFSGRWGLRCRLCHWDIRAQRSLILDMEPLLANDKTAGIACYGFGRYMYGKTCAHSHAYTHALGGLLRCVALITLRYLRELWPCH
uniref:Peptidase S1 domain-containing protein n=1 Tax=Loa loa TaxID=7209 RepID=A0A1I7W5X0_LOALO